MPFVAKRSGTIRAVGHHVRGTTSILLVALAATTACSSSEGGSGQTTNQTTGAAPSQPSHEGDPTSPADHEHHHGEAADGGTGDGSTEPAVPLGPMCDEDNPVTGTTAGSVDRELPEPIIQFERQLRWGCVHREYHETRQWDYIANNTNNADRFAYVQKMNWTRAPVQEGEPGSGLDFLAMHRAMLGTLRDRFPAHADLFKGWATIPTEATADDPLAAPNAVAASAFWDTMKTAISRLETNLGSFATEDELGLYIETQHRPTAQDPLARATDKTTGVHTYVHVRFDDPRSPIRMQRFSRNVESQTFFRLHGWVDRLWTQWRAAKGLNDETDAAYGAAMHHACMHMGLMHWSVSRGACTN